jgi:hypothetical protein
MPRHAPAGITTAQLFVLAYIAVAVAPARTPMTPMARSPAHPMAEGWLPEIGRSSITGDAVDHGVGGGRPSRRMRRIDLGSGFQGWRKKVTPILGATCGEEVPDAMDHAVRVPLSQGSDPVGHGRDAA